MGEQNENLEIEDVDESVDKNGEGGTPSPKSKVEEILAQKLGEMNQNLNANVALAKLAADPDVQAVLAAKNSGKKVRVQTEEEVQASAQASTEIPDGTDLESLSNTELVKLVVKMVGGSVERSVGKIVDSKLSPLNEQLKAVSGLVQGSQKSAIQGQITQTKKKFSDFDDYREDMVALSANNPDLSVVELYSIAKTRKGGTVSERVESEKPTGVSARPSIKQRKVPLPPGRAGFSKLLSEALDKVEFGEMEE